ncbi:MAG TPA: TetR/AcrR family transcriptional regulator [Syntrophomonadaceae bacterium]|nr:TetR/AcrR family transcriptional regulator [Syntrophomonadaceae bacterium]
MARPKDKEEIILFAAISVFKDKGFTNTTIQDIANGAGLAKGTMYEYFKSKDDLFIQALKFQAKHIDENTLDAIMNESGFINKLNLMLDFTMRKEAATHSIIMKSLFLNDSAGLKPETKREFHNFMEEMREKAIRIWADIVEQGVIEGIIGSSDAGFSAACIFSLMMVYHQFLDAQKEDVTEFKSKMLDFILNGVGYHEVQ